MDDLSQPLGGELEALVAQAVAEGALPRDVLERVVSDQTLIPSLARDAVVVDVLANLRERIPTVHHLYTADSRELAFIPDESVQLVVTSPPYWTLKKYRDYPNQLGDISDYSAFNRALDLVWAECRRVLVPGGRMVIVVGDVCLSRRKHGRHVVYPLHATIQEHCRLLGLDNLAPIIWYKIANAVYEAGGGGFLGKPYEPNAVIKNDIEYILLQRKPGSYRRPTAAMRLLSLLSVEEYQDWFQQVWTIPGASTRQHPAPFPLELATRLVRMFSFVGDTVLDPFCGTGTTMIAAAHSGRNSIGVDVDPTYTDLAAIEFHRLAPGLFRQPSLVRHTHAYEGEPVG